MAALLCGAVSKPKYLSSACKYLWLPAFDNMAFNAALRRRMYFVREKFGGFIKHIMARGGSETWRGKNVGVYLYQCCIKIFAGEGNGAY